MARAHHNPNAERARAVALRNSRLRKGLRATAALGVVVALVLAAYNRPRPMRLPPPYTPVVAWTGQHWYKAYADANGEFRNAETGQPIGQVIEWERP